MKKTVVILFSIIIMGSLFSACGNDEKTSNELLSPSETESQQLNNFDDDIINQDISSDGFEFNELEDKVAVVSYKGQAKDVVIPDTYNGKPVTVISAGAFMNNNTLVSVKCPDSLEKIGEQAFWCCKNLKSIEFGKGLISIYNSAFTYCSSLESVKIPDTVIEIGDAAFASCTSLKNITLSSNLSSLSTYLLEEIAAEEIIVPDGVERLEYLCIRKCLNLKKVVLPASVNYIDIGAFSKNGDFTIVAPAGSYAETYANENGIPFQAT